MSKSIKIRKGVNIPLKGEAKLEKINSKEANLYAIQPGDFPGLIPKLTVKEGESVKAGSPLFFDKNNPAIKFCSPVSGTVKSIVRGEKRRVLKVIVDSDGKMDSESIGTLNLDSASREDVMSKMLDFGLWPMISQRPFDIVADPADKAKSIFISGFDSNPLAPDADFMMQGREADFANGLKAITALAGGAPVHLNVKNGSSFYSSMQGVTKNTVSGPHPAGNVGVQIHKIDPINAGEVVWSISPQDVANLGHVLSTGNYNLTKTIALTGSNMSNPSYMDVRVGSQLNNALEGRITEENSRLISGNVLTGDSVSKDDFLGFYHQQITAIPEGNEPLFLLTKGWLGPGLDKFSMSRAFPSWILKGRKYDLNTNLNGEERGYVMSGQYEKVFPFDIYPVQLIKSIMANDIEMMENLGIYEVAPEDFALCEYVCTSKVEVQKVVREGLLNLKAEL